MTLGQLSQWLDNLKLRTDRQAITQPLGFDEIVMCAFAHHLAAVRNLCAHHSRVWNRKLTISMKLPKHPASVAAWFNGTEDRKIYNTLLMLTQLLDKVSPYSTWKHRLLDLLATMPADSSDQMGFPQDWQKYAVWVI
jgi:abortive infection bacteriophage resistance protein